MWRCNTIRGRKVEIRRKEEEMTTPITLPKGQIRGVEKGDSMKQVAFIVSLLGVAV